MSEFVIATDDCNHAIFKSYLREEIVRCRDCEHYEETEVRTWEFERRKMPTCGRFASFLHGTRPDGFCAWGEYRNKNT